MCSWCINNKLNKCLLCKTSGTALITKSFHALPTLCIKLVYVMEKRIIKRDIAQGRYRNSRKFRGRNCTAICKYTFFPADSYKVGPVKTPEFQTVIKVLKRRYIFSKIWANYFLKCDAAGLVFYGLKFL